METGVIHLHTTDDFTDLQCTYLLIPPSAVMLELSLNNSSTRGAPVLPLLLIKAAISVPKQDSLIMVIFWSETN